MAGLIPPGPGITGPAQSVLQSFYDALSSLLNPGAPTQFAHVATKAALIRLDPAANPGGVLICDEINCLVHSTKVSGAYVWLRADGSAL